MHDNKNFCLSDQSNTNIILFRNLDSETCEFLKQTSDFKNVIMGFTDRCFTIMESLSREQIGDDFQRTNLSDEEYYDFIVITVTFQKLVTKVSKENFTFLFEKLKTYAITHVLEPAMAGPMFSSMVKGLAIANPDETLDFFIPHLCIKIEDILLDKSLYAKVNVNFSPQFCIINQTKPNYTT